MTLAPLLVGPQGIPLVRIADLGPGGHIPHGTWYGYRYHRCRCEECMQAMTENNRKRGHKPARVAQHGTRSKYNGGCRCEPCRLAARAYERQRYQELKAARPKAEAPKCACGDRTARLGRCHACYMWRRRKGRDRTEQELAALRYRRWKDAQGGQGT